MHAALPVSACETLKRSVSQTSRLADLLLPLSSDGLLLRLPINNARKRPGQSAIWRASLKPGALVLSATRSQSSVTHAQVGRPGQVLGRVRSPTIPGRPAGKTTDFGSVNEGSNPSPGAAEAGSIHGYFGLQSRRMIACAQPSIFR